MSLSVIKQDLFESPNKALIVHAVNCQGVWGSGIAKGFKERYERSYEAYKQHCELLSERTLGFSTIHEDFTHDIGCLYTSFNYGDKKDDKETIKVHTALALDHLLNLAEQRGITKIYSNKFNSGLFGVPWEETEFILKVVLKRYPSVEWIVCEQ